MRMPRFSMNDIMALVAVVAIDIGVVRVLLTPYDLDFGTPWLAGLGGLPMGNLLLVGLWRRRGPFLQGFLVTGAAGLLIFQVLAVYFSRLPFGWYLGPIMAPFRGHNGIRIPFAVLCCMVATFLIVPQLLLASVGGILWSRLRAPRPVPPGTTS